MAMLHLLHINKNGLKTKRSEMELYIWEVKPDVVLINETKLNGKNAPKFANYTTACLRDRQTNKTRGGGVAILIRSNITYSDISPDTDDMCAIELDIGGSKYAVIAYYCPPDNGCKLKYNTLNSIFSNYNNVIIGGDLNAKHKYFGCNTTNTRGDELFDLLEQNNMVVVNNPNEKTHITPNGTSDLLDLFILSRPVLCRLVDCYVGQDVGSDHLPLHLSLKLSGNIYTVPNKSVRVYSKCNWELFKQHLITNVNKLQDISTCSSSVLDNWCTLFRELVTEALDKACPKTIIKDYAFRVRPETLALIREKRKARRKYQKSGIQEYKTAYNNLSRQVTKAIQNEKQSVWATTTASLDQFHGRQFWQKFKMLTGTSSDKSSHNKIKLTTTNGTVTDDSKIVSDMFANSLKNIHTTHSGADYCSDTEKTIKDFISEHNAWYTPSFTNNNETGDDSPLVDEITESELSSVLNRCKNKSAPGADTIPYTVLKNLPEIYLNKLANMFTSCLRCGYFPCEWKQATGIMLPKPDKDKSVVTNYRPISLLSTTGKLLEKIITTRLVDHLNSISFFNSWQRAYLENKEASEHVYRLAEEATAARNKGWFTTAVSLDAEKAFDSVWHDGLKYKLSSIGLPIKMIRFLSSFLTGRTIRVKINDQLSDKVHLNAGTPQGSVLSPILFLIYVNDLPIPDHKDCRGGQFADDISLWATARTKPATYLKIQRALDNIQRWCSKWRIKINVAKTQLITFSLSRRVPRKKLHMFNRNITEQKEFKLLGVNFDRTLLFKSHCTDKAVKAMKRVSLLRLLRGSTWGASHKTILKLYKQYVRPVLETGSVATATCNTLNINKLQVVQNTALRLALRLPYTCRISELHSQSNIQPIKVRLDCMRTRAGLRFGTSNAMNSLEYIKTLLRETV